ncbi:MAG: DUF732 domain-containing protein [Solirubrobacteraceae bacterium]
MNKIVKRVGITTGVVLTGLVVIGIAAGPTTPPVTPSPIGTTITPTSVTGPPALPIRGTVTDAAFLMALDHDGITYSTPTAAITVAHTVCTALDTGASITQVAAVIVQNSHYTTDQAGYLIGAATAGYCPVHTPS